MLGTVYNTFNHKGFGFLIDENGVNRFFHFSSFLIDEIVEPGDIVAFEGKSTNKGEIADRLSKMSLTNLAIKPSNYDEVMSKIRAKEIRSEKAIIKKQFPNLYVKKFSVQDLIDNNILQLDFNSIYTDQNEIAKSNLIASILYHLPSPPIVIHRSQTVLRMIQGQRFLKILSEFVHNEFHIEFNVFRPELTGSYFSIKPALSDKTQGYLLNLELPVQFIEGEIDEEIIEGIRDIVNYG